MTFSNLLLKTKKIEIQGVNVVIKKWSVGFTIRNGLVRQDLFGNEDIKVPTPDLDKLYDYLAEQVFEGLVSWDIATEDNQPYELTVENVKNVIVRYRDFHDDLIKEISAFNSSVTEEAKKKSK